MKNLYDDCNTLEEIKLKFHSEYGIDGEMPEYVYYTSVFRNLVLSLKIDGKDFSSITKPKNIIYSKENINFLFSLLFYDKYKTLTLEVIYELSKVERYKVQILFELIKTIHSIDVDAKQAKTISDILKNIKKRHLIRNSWFNGEKKCNWEALVSSIRNSKFKELYLIQIIRNMRFKMVPNLIEKTFPDIPICKKSISETNRNLMAIHNIKIVMEL